ncbi:MAG TPA: hypothetical protein VFE59_40810 [Trebonia sp.]|jgi:hypothetical protein|nr:hypothetical protein [Trebonia sp.]
MVLLVRPLRCAPRIRDLGKITMVRDSTPADTARLYPHVGPVLSARWNEVSPDIQDEHGGVTHDERLETVIPGAERAAGAHRVGGMVTVAGRARRMTQG